MGTRGEGGDREGGSMWKAVATSNHQLKPRGRWERGGLGESTGTKGAEQGQRGKRSRVSGKGEKEARMGTPGGHGG